MVRWPGTEPQEDHRDRDTNRYPARGNSPRPSPARQPSTACAALGGCVVFPLRPTSTRTRVTLSRSASAAVPLEFAAADDTTVGFFHLHCALFPIPVLSPRSSTRRASGDAQGQLDEPAGRHDDRGRRRRNNSTTTTTDLRHRRRASNIPLTIGPDGPIPAAGPPLRSSRWPTSTGSGPGTTNRTPSGGGAPSFGHVSTRRQQLPPRGFSSPAERERDHSLASPVARNRVHLRRGLRAGLQPKFYTRGQTSTLPETTPSRSLSGTETR